MEKSKIISEIVNLIKIKKGKVREFISSHGGAVKITDSDVEIGKKLSKILSSSEKARKEFSELMVSKSNSIGDVLNPISGVLGGITDIFSSSAQRKIADQQGEDAITLALINAGIARSKPDNTSMYIAFGILALVLIIVGVLLYLKLRKKG